MGKTEEELAQERNIAEYNAGIQVGLSVITLGQSALKSAVLINGAAAVAMLSMMGNIWNSTSTGYSTAISLASAIALFTLGVLAAAVGTGATYCSQHLYVSKKNKYGLFFQGLAIILVICSYGFFAWASWCAYNGFLKHFAV